MIQQTHTDGTTTTWNTDTFERFIRTAVLFHDEIPTKLTATLNNGTTVPVYVHLASTTHGQLIDNAGNAIHDFTLTI